MTTRIPIRLKAPGSKMRNVRVQVDGIWFDSKKEANRWSELKLLERAGKIISLVRQFPYDLYVNSNFICTYRADFVYHHYTEVPQGAKVIGPTVVEDAKGRKSGNAYRLFIIKKSLMKACHGIDIVEI